MPQACSSGVLTHRKVGHAAGENDKSDNQEAERNKTQGFPTAAEMPTHMMPQLEQVGHGINDGQPCL
jgi:hypothetical protein